MLVGTFERAIALAAAREQGPGDPQRHQGSQRATSPARDPDICTAAPASSRSSSPVASSSQVRGSVSTTLGGFPRVGGALRCTAPRRRAAPSPRRWRPVPTLPGCARSAGRLRPARRGRVRHRWVPVASRPRRRPLPWSLRIYTASRGHAIESRKVLADHRNPPYRMAGAVLLAILALGIRVDRGAVPGRFRTQRPR